MKKLDRSKVMKRAWEFIKEYKWSKSVALKAAWTESKAVEETTIMQVRNKAEEVKEKIQSTSSYNVVLSVKEWVVSGKIRVYFRIDSYKKGRNSKRRDSISLGYYDKINKKYVLADKWDKDVFAL